MGNFKLKLLEINSLMNIDILTYYPAMIVVSTERENEFRARPRMRTRHAAEKNHTNYYCTTTKKEL